MTDVSLNVNSPAHLSLLYLPFKMITLLALQRTSRDKAYILPS